MRKFLWLLLACLLVGGGWWAWKKLFPPDEVLITRLLEQTAQAASFGGQQSDLARMAGAGDLALCFTSDALLKLDAAGGEFGSVRGRNQVQQLAMAARQHLGSLKVVFKDVSVQLDGSTNAKARLIVDARGTGIMEPYLRELKIGFTKEDGTWLISSLETVQALKRVD